MENDCLVYEVEFHGGEAAQRLARWVNRHFGAGRARKKGCNVVFSSAIRRGTLARGYLSLGIAPHHEWMQF